MKPYLEITDSGLASLKAFAESNGNSIVMVNLMQVRPNAAYEAPLAGNCTGYEALARYTCLLYTSPSPRDVEESRMPSSA